MVVSKRMLRRKDRLPIKFPHLGKRAQADFFAQGYQNLFGYLTAGAHGIPDEPDDNQDMPTIVSVPPIVTDCSRPAVSVVK